MFFLLVFFVGLKDFCFLSMLYVGKVHYSDIDLEVQLHKAS